MIMLIIYEAKMYSGYKNIPLYILRKIYLQNTEIIF